VKKSVLDCIECALEYFTF